MVRLAIIDDVLEDARHISALVCRYSEATGIQIKQELFESAATFLCAKKKFDIILLDIIMPGYSGMKLARQLRALDNDTRIIFMTSMEQYAIEGYSVDAMGFLLKPMSYEQIAAVLGKAVEAVKRTPPDTVLIKTDTEYILVDPSLIEFVEVKGHILNFHTSNGDFQTCGTLKDIIGKLGNCQFYRVNNYTIVNAKHIQAIRANTVVLPSAEITISRRKKAEFIESYLRYVANLG